MKREFRTVKEYKHLKTGGNGEKTIGTEINTNVMKVSRELKHLCIIGVEPKNYKMLIKYLGTLGTAVTKEKPSTGKATNNLNLKFQEKTENLDTKK